MSGRWKGWATTFRPGACKAVPLRTPFWWHGSGGALVTALLEPIALMWRLVDRVRWATANPYKSRLPVICIGNFTAGGAGKTPTALAIAKLLTSAGEKPVFLTRGYGGSLSGPHLVDAATDTSRDVGDEALLLAQAAPAIVSADRANGARLAESLGCSVIVMDDGFQNPTLAKDFSLVVVDRARGLGNGSIIPAGPMRASLASQLARADAILLVGEGNAGDSVAASARQRQLPVFTASLAPAGKTDWLRNKSFVAFTGIAHADKFFDTLEQVGATLEQRIEFPDHHEFSDGDATRLLAAADQARSPLVTTQKDWVRLEHKGGVFKTLCEKTRALPVAMTFQETAKLMTLVKEALARQRRA